MITVKEARQILGEKADGMTDDEIEFVIETLSLMAKDALKLTKEDLHRKRDAKRLAELIYDVYQEKLYTKNASEDG